MIKDYRKIFLNSTPEILRWGPSFHGGPWPLPCAARFLLLTSLPVWCFCDAHFPQPPARALRGINGSL